MFPTEGGLQEAAPFVAGGPDGTAAVSQRRQQAPASPTFAAAGIGYSASEEDAAATSGGLQRVVSVPDTPPSPFMVAQRDLAAGGASLSSRGDLR